MTKKTTTTRKKKNIAEGNITLNDFANATSQRNRLKKAQNQTIIPSSIDDLLDEGNLENDVANIELSTSANKNQFDCNEIHVYNDYHIDIWFLISEHIQPEDTGRFALICRKTEAVVCSAKYWSNLYRRYYSYRINLPTQLRPDHMDRIGGLRAKVICSLFFTYSTFTQRLLNPQRNNLSKLEGLHLMQTWYKNVKEGIWVFYYKFSNRIIIRKPSKKIHTAMDVDEDFVANLDKFLVEYNNVFENRFEGQHLLVVTSDRFIPFPDFFNQKITLSLVRQPLSKDLRKTGLELTFTNYRKMIVAISSYETVLDYRIWNWWDPEFSIYYE